jgi:hypothetical protein
MIAAELLEKIEVSGGTVTLLPSGDLHWRHVAPEFVAQSQSLKAEIADLLRDREKPRAWSGLIPLPDLLAAQGRYRERQAAACIKRAADMQAEYARQQAERAAQSVVPESKPFVYQARTPEQWRSRAEQGRAKKPSRRYGRKPRQ